MPAGGGVRLKQGLADGIEEVVAKLRRHEKKNTALLAQNAALDSAIRAAREKRQENEVAQLHEEWREHTLVVDAVRAKLALEVASAEQRKLREVLRAHRLVLAEDERQLSLARGGIAGAESASQYQHQRVEDEEMCATKLEAKIKQMEAEIVASKKDLRRKQRQQKKECAEKQKTAENMSEMCASLQNALNKIQ